VEDELLTVAEVAEHLRLNQQTVRNMIDRGSFPRSAWAPGAYACVKATWTRS
jgi:excisionase family DNA binding protein